MSHTAEHERDLRVVIKRMSWQLHDHVCGALANLATIANAQDHAFALGWSNPCEIRIPSCAHFRKCHTDRSDVGKFLAAHDRHSGIASERADPNIFSPDEVYECRVDTSHANGKLAAIVSIG